MSVCSAAVTVGDLRMIVERSFSLGRALYDLSSTKLKKAQDTPTVAYFQSVMARLAGSWTTTWKFLYQTTRAAILPRPTLEAFTYNVYTAGSWDAPPEGWNTTLYGKWAPLTNHEILCAAMSLVLALSHEVSLPAWKLTAEEKASIDALRAQYATAVKEVEVLTTTAATAPKHRTNTAAIALGAGLGLAVLVTAGVILLRS